MNDRSDGKPERPKKPRVPRPSVTPAANFKDAKPRRVDVLNAYRWLLGREPENPGVLARHVAGADTNEVLRLRMLRSAEFSDRHGAAAPPTCRLDASPQPIETEAPPDAIYAMQARLRSGWSRLGETAPHFSCLPEARFRPERIAAHRREFLASGLDDRMLLEGVLGRLGIAPGRLGRLVDFGCGVGRATLHLAAIFPELTGVDISAKHLVLARDEARARGMDHIGWVRWRAGQPMPGEGCGLWFSRGVLQHCPPPLALHLLRLGFAVLAPGGVAVFQLLTHGAGYGFAVGDEPGPTDLHVLPQAKVFAAAADAGVSVLEVQEDLIPGLDRRRWVSHLFVMRKPR